MPDFSPYPLTPFAFLGEAGIGLQKGQLEGKVLAQKMSMDQQMMALRQLQEQRLQRELSRDQYLGQYNGQHAFQDAQGNVRFVKTPGGDQEKYLAHDKSNIIYQTPQGQIATRPLPQQQ